MGLFFNKREGGLMDVIRCDEENYLVWKWRPAGHAVNSTSKENAIRWGSSLRVKDGEMCVFVYRKDGRQVMDFINGPYEGTLKTENLPLLTSIVGLAWGGETPFQAEIYFFNLQGNNQIKFAIPYFDVADPRYLDFTVPVAVRGSITFNLTNVKQFIKLNRIVDFSLDQFSEQIVGMVKKLTKNFVSNCPVEQGIPVLQIERKIVEISDLLQARIAPQLADDFGVNLKRIDLCAIEIDKESPDYAQFVHITKEQQMIQAEQIGRRAQIDTEIYAESGRMSIQTQHIQAHAINKQAEVLKAAAEGMGQMESINLGGGGDGLNPAGMMMGMAMGGSMGQQMASMMSGGMNAMQQTMQQPQMQQQAPHMTPPPIPGNVSYMLAINGQQYGPYNMQQLQQMVISGQLTAQTLVWCQGMAAWEPACNRPDLASLFAPAAPPIPPTPTVV